MARLVKIAKTQLGVATHYTLNAQVGVEVSDSRLARCASNDTSGFALDALHHQSVRVAHDDGKEAAVVEDGADESLVGDEKKLLAGSPAATADRAHHGDPFRAASLERFDVGCEGEVVVEDDAEELGFVVDSERHTAEVERQRSSRFGPTFGEQSTDSLAGVQLDPPLCQPNSDLVKQLLQSAHDGDSEGTRHPSRHVVGVQSDVGHRQASRNLVEEDDEKERGKCRFLQYSYLFKVAELKM